MPHKAERLAMEEVRRGLVYYDVPPLESSRQRGRMNVAEIQQLVFGVVQGVASSTVFILVLFIGFCVVVGFTKLKKTAGGAMVVKSLDEQMTAPTDGLPARRARPMARSTSSRPRNFWRPPPVNRGMFCLLFGILFFPIVLPFLILRFVLKLVFGLLMLPFVLLMVVFALVMAVFGVVFALATPLLPFVLIALAIWAVTRHSRAASAIPNS